MICGRTTTSPLHSGPFGPYLLVAKLKVPGVVLTSLWALFFSAHAKLRVKLNLGVSKVWAEKKRAHAKFSPPPAKFPPPLFRLVCAVLGTNFATVVFEENCAHAKLRVKLNLGVSEVLAEKKVPTN